MRRGTSGATHRIMSTPSYAMARTLEGLDPETARARVTEALKAEGFGILTEIDVSATLKKKIDVDFRPYLILGACNPKLAHRALEAEPSIGLMLPCNVVLEAVDGGVKVSMQDPDAMFGVVDNPGLRPVATEARERLSRALAAL